MTISKTIANVGVSWKTSGSGIVLIALGVLLILSAAFGWGISLDDPEIRRAVDLILYGVGGTGLVAGVQGLFARDGDKSSQDVGVRR